MTTRTYLVRVHVPLTVCVTIDNVDPEAYWRDEYAAANQAAIAQVIDGFDDTTMTEALKILKNDGLGYPNDFAEVCEIVD